MSQCVCCVSRRGKIVRSGCNCTVHKVCARELTYRQLKENTEDCQICKTQIHSPPQLARALRRLLDDSPFKIRKNSMQPVVYYYPKKPTDLEEQDNLRWREFCLHKATLFPSWATPTLTRASKKKVRYIVAVSKWD